jgi:excisionase family DNA binding protein
MKDEYKPPPDTYYTRKEAARALRLSLGYLDKLRRHGLGPDYCVYGRCIRIPASSLQAWATARLRRGPFPEGRAE